MRQHGFPDARGLHGLTPAAPIRSRCRLWADPEGPAAIRHGRLPGSTCRAGRLTGGLILTQSGYSTE